MEEPKVDILVVDDNPTNLVAAAAILNELGQNVVKATSGAEALRRLLTQEFALIILDVRMPDMDGYETARLIRDRDKTRATPIIFLTAFDRSEAQVMRAYELGAVDFLQKPIVPTVLKSKAAVFVELFRKTIEVTRQSEVLREVEKKEHERALVVARQKWEAEKLRAEMEQSRRAAEVIAAKAAELAHTVSERERAEEALRQSNQRLRLLSETATRLLHGARPQDLVTSLFDQISAHLGLEVELGFTVDNGHGLVLDSWAGLDEGIAHARAGQILDEVCDKVVSERRRLIVENLGMGDRFPAMRALGVEAFVCYPLLAQGRLMGTLIFGTRRRGVFEIDELAVMQVFCDQVAVAMERARLLLELERRNRELAESDRRKDEFLAMLGHELRNPLAPMMTALQLMRLRGDEDKAVVKAHRAMDRQLRHIVRLVDDLLDVSRINSGKIELRKEVVDLAGVLEHGLATSRPLIADRGHHLHVDAPIEPVHVQVDPTRISQVISNLLNNAAKYTPHGGNIWLGVEIAGSDLIVRVRDDGMGIDPAEMGRVFELFVQTHAANERAQGGLGIGLTLVKRLIELHGGEVSGESKGAGTGSEFTVRLPGVVVVVAEEPQLAEGELIFATGSARGTAAISSPPSLNPLRILVVEDNDDIRETLKDLLVMCGHQVEVAEDGERGLELVLEHKPNVALIDIGLPGLDGYHVARALRDRQPGRETRLIALTGYGQPDDRRKALDAGFDAHLVKPVDLEHLSKVLAEQIT